MNRRTIIAAAALAATALAPATAGAHVTLQPKEAPAGQYVRLDVRVPNERDDAGTRKVQVQFPPGFASASYEPAPGWDVEVKMRKAAEPIEQHGETVDEEVDTVTWTGKGEDGVVPPGAFRDFGLSVRIPEKPDTDLTFKAIQTYQGGEVVRWIGPADGDEPAPTVRVTAAADDGHGAGAGDTAQTEDTAAPAAAVAEDGDDGGSDGLAIAALIVGALGLVAGGAALATRRRTA